MTQLLLKEFVSQLWRLNSITKLEKINFSFSCHLHWKDGCWQTTYLFSGRLWTGVQKHLGLLLSCTFPGHQTLLRHGVTTDSVFSGKLHNLWCSGGNRGRKNLQNEIIGGKSFQNVLATYHMKMQTGDGQCPNLLSREAWGRAELPLQCREALPLNSRLPQALSQHLTTQLITLGQDDPSLRWRDMVCSGP